jgi:hypothetical protein
MKAELLRKLYQDHWASRLPGFEVQGHLLYAIPCGSVLCGFCFESSAWSKTAVHITAFAQPLYVPSDHVVLTYGKRLGARSHRWELDGRTSASTLDELAMSLESDGMKFLKRRQTPTLLAGAYRWEAAFRKNPHMRQLVAFSLAKSKKSDKALRMLNKLRRPKPDAPEWERAIASESEMLVTALERGGEQGDQLLTEWEARTRKSLKLPQ